MAIRDAGNQPVMDAATPQTNPTAGTRLADSGQLVVGIYEARIVVGGSAPSIFNWRRRNAADNANVGDVIVIRTLAGGSSEFVWTWSVETNERIDVAVNTEPGAGNTMEAAIEIEKLS